jgi:hypothetical protein
LLSGGEMWRHGWRLHLVLNASNWTFSSKHWSLLQTGFYLGFF